MWHNISEYYSAFYFLQSHNATWFTLQFSLVYLFLIYRSLATDRKPYLRYSSASSLSDLDDPTYDPPGSSSDSKTSDGGRGGTKQSRRRAVGASFPGMVSINSKNHTTAFGKPRVIGRRAGRLLVKPRRQRECPICGQLKVDLRQHLIHCHRHLTYVQRQEVLATVPRATRDKSPPAVRSDEAGPSQSTANDQTAMTTTETVPSLTTAGRRVRHARHALCGLACISDNATSLKRAVSITASSWQTANHSSPCKVSAVCRIGVLKAVALASRILKDS
jgi:hypothetical protein